MASINAYLNFNGNTEEAFNFYKSVFGGEFLGVMRYKDTPESDKIALADHDKIMHVALPIGNGNMLMATDTLESMGHQVNFGNNISLSVNLDSHEEANRVFNGLSDGGQVMMPLQKMFWNAYWGMLTDKFGVQWMINYDLNRSN